MYLSNLYRYLLLSFVFLLLIQCGDDKKISKQAVNPAFTGYVAAFTSGVLSSRSTIQVRLMENMKNVTVNQLIEKDLFDFEPDIAGKAYWIDQRTIEFKPDEELPSGQIYEAEFFLSKLIKVPDNLKTLTFQFQVMQQSVSVYYEGMKAMDTKDLKWQKIIGKLNTSDQANDNNIEKILTAKQNGKVLNIKWAHESGTRVHQFMIDSVHRTEDRGKVILEWDGSIIGSTSEGEMEVEIPPLGEFKVLNLNVVQQPTQYIAAYFSDPVDPNQNLEGLVRILDQEVRWIVEENIVKIYPKERLLGEVNVLIEDGIRNTLGYNLMEEFAQNVTFRSVKPNIELIGDGIILPSSDGLIFPFKAVSLKAVNVKIIKIFEDNVAQFLQVNQFDGTREMKRVGRIVYKNTVQLTSDKPIDYGQWNTFSLNLADLIQTDPGAIYRVHISFDQYQSLYPCNDNEQLGNEQVGIGEDPEMAGFDSPDDYYYYDDYYYDDYGYDYNWDEKDNPCSSSYYARNAHSIARNVFASDLGIIAKGGNSNNLKVVVTDLRTTDPLPGVKLKIYNFQNRLMTEAKTDGDGMANIGLTKKPFLLVATNGKQVGYLRLDDGSALSMSMFNIGGQENQKGVKGFLYGERGVWRPGDTVFLNFIMEDELATIPDNHPVVLELYTPENQLIKRIVRTTSLNGFYNFTFETEPDAPTGKWLAKVKIGGSEFTQTIRIEAIKPNRLKIIIDFGNEILTNIGGQKGQLQAKWLHGATAKNLKADVETILAEGKTNFKNYPDYHFDDPAKNFEAQEKTIFEGNLDENGIATINPAFQVGNNAPGMLKAQFKTRVFENSGDFSIDRYVLPYSPYRSYIGVKVPEGSGWNSAIYSNENTLVPVVIVDENGNPTSRDKVKIEIFDVYWRWWWESSDDYDLARYVSNREKNLLKTDYISTANGKAMYEMNLDGEYWGRKYIKVTDPVSGHSTGQLFYTSYKGWWNSSGTENPGGAEMLTFTTDKKSYKVGEEVQVELPNAQKGRTLVSIESGSKVIQTFWVQMEAGKKSFRFKATPDMAPNVYVHLTLLQPHKHDNDLPIRLYGVQSIAIEDPNTHLNPVISMAEELSPESKVTIKVSEKNNKKMTYTVAVVDEGLLDLTRFKTPNPWEHFYTREALGVKTWDMYKYVLGAFTGEMAGLLALGGDEFINNKEQKDVNRFKPVVKFMGPFELDRGKTATHTFTMPNYVGSVRTMVIAGQDGAYGFAEETTPVKQPLMVLGTLPRVLSPGESVKLPVTVFAMDKNIKNVSVQIVTNDMLPIVGATQQNIRFNEEGDQIVTFDLKVAERIGVGAVKIIAESGKTKSVYDIELKIRAPNPRITKVIDGVVGSGQSWEQKYEAVGMKGTNHGVLEVSRIPSIDLETRLKYLISYPHGCVEQITSAVFPQLFLSNLIELDADRKIQIEDNIRTAINNLKKFQVNNGGLSYWPGSYDRTANEWGTSYAGHFMLEAKTKGYDLPIGFLPAWIQYQTQMANDWQPKQSEGKYYHRSDELIQSYRLYTLALAGEPALGAMNRMRENKTSSTAAVWRLASAYQLTGKTEVAKELVQALSTKIQPYKELAYSYGSSERDQAMILETLVLLNDKSRAKKVLDDLVKEFNSGSWHSTQTTAYTLLAIAKFTGENDEKTMLDYQYTLNGKSETIRTDHPVSQIKIPMSSVTSGKVKVTNEGSQVLFVKVQLDGIPAAGKAINQERDLEMTVRYLDMAGNTIDPANLRQGTDFMAEVKLHHPGVRRTYQEMALTQLFPSGWEIRNTRLDEVSSTKIVDEPTYQDIRGDRVYTYFDIEKNSTKTFRILLNATYEGEFYLPAVNCEAMYDNTISATKTGDWVKVVR